MIDRRSSGPVRVRWFGHSDSAVEAEDAEVADVLAEAAAKWYASNNSPDAFVMAVVIERDGSAMTDEQADAYLQDQLHLKRTTRQSSFVKEER